MASSLMGETGKQTVIIRKYTGRGEHWGSEQRA